MIGWAIYAIGAMTVITEMLEPQAHMGRIRVPPEHLYLYGAVIVAVALLWPLLALGLVFGRIIGAMHNG
jgi:hypothetical protein